MQSPQIPRNSAISTLFELHNWHVTSFGWKKRNITVSPQGSPNTSGWGGIEAGFHVYQGLSIFKKVFCEISTWSKGTPLVEVEMVNDLRGDEE